MFGMRRHRIYSYGAARTAEPQNLSRTVQAMRWQGTDNRARQMRRKQLNPSPEMKCELTRYRWGLTASRPRPCVGSARPAHG
jgi:hypothetical protein